LPKRALHRFVLDGDDVVADPLQRLPGRGAYVCSAACLQEAIRRRAFARAYRRPVRVDPGLGTPVTDPDTRLED
jgi:predicted RNA-binding protein YlxR (DUF448 family)